MTQEERIVRINELARKAKAEGLTPAEETERQQLRADYLADFRAGLRGQLDNTYIVGPDGIKRKLERKEKKQPGNGH